MSALLPCPFCGGEGMRRRVLRRGYRNHRDNPDAFARYVRCRSCAAQGPWRKTAGGAAREWNRRAGVVASVVVAPEDGGWRWRIEGARVALRLGAREGLWTGDQHHAVAQALARLPDPPGDVWRVEVKL